MLITSAITSLANVLASLTHSSELPHRLNPPASIPAPLEAMAWRCSGSTNAGLVSNLAGAGIIKSPRVRSAMGAVDRAHFCLHPSVAYEDSPQSIGYAATISAPHMHAAAAESLLPFLKPVPERGPEGGIADADEVRVLDIGSGSGYLTAVFAEILGGAHAKGARVVGIDHIQGLVDMARANMAKSASGRQMLESGIVEFVLGDGRKGHPAAGPYDAIHVGAAAKEVHEELLDQLKSPGRMFIPVEDPDGWGSQWIWVVDKDKDGRVKRRKDMGVRYVPLTDAPR